MSHRSIAALLTVIAIVVLIPMFAASQSASTTALPRTRCRWGVPDLEGVWDFRSLTPMELFDPKI